MKSRMEKYYKEEELMQRTSKNDLLYDELYREKMPRSNVTVLDNINEIDISKIKAMVDKRENYSKVKDYNNLVNKLDDYKKDEINYDFEEVDSSNYDINEILKRKRVDNNYDASKVRSISSKDYEMLSSLDKKEDSVDMLSHEMQLKDLFNTVSRVAVDDGDLFANLKEDDKKEDEESFYTSTSKFDQNDFSDNEIEEKTGSNVFVIIAVVVSIIAILLIVYLKFIK